MRLFSIHSAVLPIAINEPHFKRGSARASSWLHTEVINHLTWRLGVDQRGEIIGNNLTSLISISGLYCTTQLGEPWGRR